MRWELGTGTSVLGGAFICPGGGVLILVRAQGTTDSGSCRTGGVGRGLAGGGVWTESAADRGEAVKTTGSQRLECASGAPSSLAHHPSHPTVLDGVLLRRAANGPVARRPRAHRPRADSRPPCGPSSHAGSGAGAPRSGPDSTLNPGPRDEEALARWRRTVDSSEAVGISCPRSRHPYRERTAAGPRSMTGGSDRFDRKDTNHELKPLNPVQRTKGFRRGEPNGPNEQKLTLRDFWLTHGWGWVCVSPGFPRPRNGETLSLGVGVFSE